MVFYLLYLQIEAYTEFEGLNSGHSSLLGSYQNPACWVMPPHVQLLTRSRSPHESGKEHYVHGTWCRQKSQTYCPVTAKMIPIAQSQKTSIGGPTVIITGMPFVSIIIKLIQSESQGSLSLSYRESSSRSYIEL